MRVHSSRKIALILDPYATAGKITGVPTWTINRDHTYAYCVAAGSTRAVNVERSTRRISTGHDLCVIHQMVLLEFRNLHGHPPK
jgi:hypothetical protein